MLTELIMHRMGWTDIWYAHPGSRGVFRDVWRWLRWDGRWHVGVWTGPEADLLSVRYCDTNAEAERWLSPGGRTILTAVLGALWRSMRPLEGAKAHGV